MEDKGLLITCEGNDGSGKTSVLKLVAARLASEGYKFYLTREPGGNAISEQIRDIILDNANTAMDAKTEALLYAASRRQHLIENVFPRLKRGEIVISDRYVDSSLAYQGYARNIGIDEVLQINMFAIDGRLPDYTILFDIEPEEGLRRIAASKGRQNDRLDNETIDFHRRVHYGYMLLSDRFKERYVLVDANKPIETVTEKVCSLIRNRIDAYLKQKEE